MTRLGLAIASIFISTAFIAVNGFPGSIQLNRVARSPYYGGFGFHPPPPFPFFQTNNWSGITRGATGNTNGVYSGAAASATNTAPATGQALSLASADCDDDDSVQSTGTSDKLAAGFSGRRGDNSGGFGGQFSAHKEARYSFQSGGGKFEAEGSGLSGQSGTGSHGQLNLGASSSANGNIGATEQSKGNGFYSSNQDSTQAGSKLIGVDQSGGFSSSSAHSSTSGSAKGNVQQQAELVSGGINSENDDCDNQDTQTGLNAESGQKNTGFAESEFNKHDHNLGFTQNLEQNREHSQQQYGIPNQQGEGLSQHESALSQQTLTGSYGQQNKVGGAFGQQNGQLKEQVGLNGKYSQQTHQSGYGQQKGIVGHQQNQGAFSQSQSQIGYGQHVYQGGFNKQQGEATLSQEEQNQGAYGQSQGQAGFGQHLHQGGFNEQQGQASLSHEEQFKHQNLQGGNGASSHASSYAHGRGFGFGKGFSGHDHGYGNDFNSKYQANQELQQHQTGSESTSGNSESQSAGSSSIGGALNLASQGLEAAQKTGCSTCGGNGGYAFSNARSHSGSAISVAIGG
ncbi:filaggrin-2-like [Pieris rapae]|uniref:filaggrin-2-like n=1 Tax=Pieris rapae TaxID=64459 RepID=UPI001E27B1BA|nr:filaggrin-2-like [Pieris rapae]